MNYSQLKSNKVDSQETVYFYEHTLQRTSDGIVLIDNKETSFTSFLEAKKHIKITNDINERIQEIKDDFYTENKPLIANIIKETHDIKLTNTVLENYINLASNLVFTIDPAVHQIRELNYYDNVVKGKLHYKLNDNSIIAISENTQTVINNVLQDKPQVIEFMKENSDNFLKILDVIIKEQ